MASGDSTAYKNPDQSGGWATVGTDPNADSRANADGDRTFPLLIGLMRETPAVPRPLNLALLP